MIKKQTIFVSYIEQWLFLIDIKGNDDDHANVSTMTEYKEPRNAIGFQSDNAEHFLDFTILS